MKKTILFMPLAMALLVFSVGFDWTNTKNYPNKNITILLPRAPGGGTDTSARGTIEYVKDALPSGISFVPVNKPAGAGVGAMVEGARARPDGYTLTMLIVESTMLPHLGRMPATYADFRSICTPIADPAALIVNADAPFNSVQEFIDYAKANPGKLQMANPGMGGIMHLAAVNVEQKCGVSFKHVPYTEGTGPIIAALVGGHVDATFGTPGTAKAQVEAGKLKILGVMDTKRFPLFPDVPTFKEAYGVDFAMRAWAVLAAPANTPDDIIKDLIRAFSQGMRKPEYAKYMENQGIVPVEILGAEADKMMADDHATYGELLKVINMK